MSEPKFKFELGDIVRHVTQKHNSVFTNEETLAAVIVCRSWHEESGGLFYSTYTIDTVQGRESGVPEIVLELVTKSP